MNQGVRLSPYYPSAYRQRCAEPERALRITEGH